MKAFWLVTEIGNWVAPGLKGCLSEIGLLDSSLLQGFVLGPLLILIYVNDIADELEDLCLKFTGDIQILKTEQLGYPEELG